MTTGLPDLRCSDEDRRREEIAQSANVQAIDYLETSAGQLALDVHFVPKRTAVGNQRLRDLLDDLAANPAQVRVTGGERVRHIAVVSAARSGLVLRVRVDRPGDFSTYRLTITDPRMDPSYTSIAFSFKAGCPSRFDCSGDCECEDVAPPEPEIDYLAKDYRSFRQALIDRLPAIAPEWVERHEADLGLALLELLAYAGGQLSYQQDAVANEAYLSSARQRVSVRRHARLVDYAIDEGASARAFVVATVLAPYVLPRWSQLLTRRDLPFEDELPPLDAVLIPSTPEHAEQARAEAAAIFETRADTTMHPSLNEIALYGWDLADCCLPVGATTVDLLGDLRWHPATTTDPVAWGLVPGSLLTLEETAGREIPARLGDPSPPDPTHRQVVRLTGVEAVSDPLHPAAAITRVTWSDADALTFPLCVNRPDAEGVATAIAVARGNTIVADHGQVRPQWWPARPAWDYPTVLVPAPPGLVRGARATRFLLDEGPLSMWRPLGDEPVAAMDAVAPVPAIEMQVSTNAADAVGYTVLPDLLDAHPFEPRFAVEVTNDARASIRFGDDVSGRAPVDGAFVHATYRVGLGRAGNVGAETLRHVLLSYPDPLPPAWPPTPVITKLPNPLPAIGGRDPETIAQVKVAAPVAFRSPQRRAVTEADYAEVATRVQGVAGCVARFRWTGSWLTVYLIVDAHDRDALDATLADEIKASVQRFTQTGYDLEVRPATYVALDVELFVCVAGDRFRTDVERTLRRVLSSRRLADGTLGFFHPDRFGFAQPLYLSSLYAAAAAVPGVESVEARRFSRFFDDDPAPARPVTAANIAAGVITVGDIEVLELLGDPSLPERGVLDIVTGGGR